MLLLLCENNANGVYGEKKQFQTAAFSLEITSLLIRVNHTRAIKTHRRTGGCQVQSHVLQFLEEVVNWTFCLFGSERDLSTSRMAVPQSLTQQKWPN